MSKILIVEDSPSFRKILGEFLVAKSSSILIAEAESGKDALEKVNSFCPDLILMDIRLEDESGLDLARTIKSHSPKVKVVILTSYDFPEYQEAAGRYGVDGFCIKGSVKFEELLTMVNSLLPR
jgi:two-component system response regulator YesN